MRSKLQIPFKYDMVQFEKLCSITSEPPGKLLGMLALATWERLGRVDRVEPASM